MATYSPQSLGIKAPSGGFQQGGWYAGRQYWNGSFSEVGAIHEQSNQVGAGQMVSPEVNAASAQAQGVTPQQFESYLQQQRRITPSAQAASGSIPTTTTSGGSIPSGGGASLGSITPQATLNLPDLYRNLYETSGVQSLEQDLASKEMAKIEAEGKINDNPYISEATRVGRVAKLEQLHAQRTQAIRDQIATKRADIETQLNLQTKQFDINSQVAKDALTRLNSLLEMGMLDNASGETIAQLTANSGVTSDMIYSAINKRKEDNVQTQVIQSTNDAGVVTVSVIDQKTGNVISQKSLGAIGNAQTGGGQSVYDKQTELKAQMVQALEATKNSYGHVGPQDWQGAMASWIARGGDRADFIANFSQYADPNRGDFDQVYYNRSAL